MFISLHDLQLRRVRFNVEIPAGEIDYDSSISQASDLHSEGTAQLLNHSLGEIRIQGNLNVSMETTCDRCLETTKFPIDNEFDLVYMPATEASGGRMEEEIGRDGMEVGYYEGNGLALNDILREVILLALPMRLTCDEACKGICPVCGENRNQRDCGCQANAADDRWSKLKALRAEMGSHN